MRRARRAPRGDGLDHRFVVRALVRRDDAKLLLRRVEARDQALELGAAHAAHRMPYADVGRARRCSAQQQRARRVVIRNIRRRVYSRLTMAAIHERSAAELAAAYARGELSPVQVTRALLERIAGMGAAHQRHVPRACATAALEQARAAEARWRAGRPLSALDGVPLTIKENIYTRGDPAPIGTRANEDARAAERRRAARGARARSGLRDPRQDHHARLRHAVLGPFEPARRDAQPVAASIAILRARAPAPAPPRSRATRRCTSAPTSAARCACRRRTAASSRSSPRSAACRSTRLIWAASPGR